MREEMTREQPIPFAVRLRCVMKRFGMTQAELAKVVDICPKSVWHYLTGRSLPKYETYDATANAFGMSIGQFENYKLSQEEIDSAAKKCGTAKGAS